MKTIYQAKHVSAPYQPGEWLKQALSGITFGALCWVLFPTLVFTQTYEIERGKSRTFTETAYCPGATQFRVMVRKPSYLGFVSLGGTIDLFGDITVRFAISASSTAPLGSNSVDISYEFGDFGIFFCSKTFYYTIVVTAPPAPVANFTAKPTFGLTPLTVQFTDQSSGGNVTSRLWNFGDGRTSTATNPTHTYQNPSQFTVSLTLTGPGGSDTETKANYITATKFPPDITVSPDSIRVTVSKNDSTTQTLTIGNSGTGELYFSISASGAMTATLSAFKQSLIYFDGNQTFEGKLEVAEQNTLAETNPPNFDISLVGGQAVVNPADDWLAFSPASGMVAPNGSQNIALTFRTANLISDTTYRASLLIASNDPDETQVTIPMSLTVPAGPNPRALFTVSPTSGFIGSSFNVDASASRDGQTSANLLEVRWDWENDGTWDTPYSTTKTASHQYLSPGTKTIQLEVKDADGNTDLRRRTVNVSNRAPASFSLLLPTNGDTVKVLTPAFKWRASSDPDLADTVRYQIFISTSSFFSSASTDTFSAEKDTTLTLPTVLKQRTRYYWKVQATDRWGQSTFSTQSWSFMSPDFTPSAPTLVSPVNGAVNLPAILTSTWNPSAGAITYRLQVSINSSFTTIVFDDSTITITSHQVGPLKDNTTYYWRVNAKNANGSGVWSTVWRFTTIALPNQVVLISPAPGDIIKADSVRFLWRKSGPGVNRYWFELAKDSLLSNRTVIDTTLADTTRMARKLENKQLYWWRVKAQNAAGWGPFSLPRKFRLDISTGVATSEDVSMPTEFALSQNYPNPFNPSTTITFSLSRPSHVVLKIFNTLGEEVATLVNHKLKIGQHQVIWHANSVASGVYLYRLQSEEGILTKKMILMR